MGEVREAAFADRGDVSIIASLFGATAGKVINSIGGVLGRFIESPEQRRAAELEIANLIQARDSELEQTIRSEMDAKARVLEAELKQDDNFTKRARPTVVYAGLVLVTVNNVILPWVSHFTGDAPPSIEIPGVFWTAWAGICATWVIGRTAEKRGAGNQLTRLITGGSVRAGE